MIPVYRTTRCGDCGAVVTISVDIAASERFIKEKLGASLQRHRLTKCDGPVGGTE